MTVKSSTPLLVVKGLSCCYPLSRTPVFNNISLGIRAGEIVAILGENGSGKTTFGLCLGGIIPRLINAEMKGQVILCGKDIAHNDFESITDEIGYVLQNPENQFLGLTVEEELRIARLNRNKSRALESRAQSIYDLLGVSPLLDRYIYDLSLGQKQRVALAATLSKNPAILILDQPFSNLDPVGNMQLRELLMTLNKTRGTSIILLTPDVRDIRRFASTSYLLENGKLRQCSEGELITDLRRFQEDQPSTSTMSSRVSHKLLTLEGVSYRYPRSRDWAVNNLDLCIRKGEAVGIVGLNGSGKSTLLYLLAALLLPQVGRYTIDGQDTKKMGFTELSTYVSLVFQNPEYQIFSSTIEGELKFGLKNMQLNEEDIQKRIAKLTDLLPTQEIKRDPRGLSFGQKKLISLVGALAMDSQCYLLDEPELGLDNSFGRRFEGIIKDLHSKGRTIVIASHDLNLINALTERVIFLDKGKIVNKGHKSRMIPLIKEYYQERLKMETKIEVR